MDAEHTKTILPSAFGKPLSARSKDRHFAIMRAFFKDLQDEPHLIPRRFDPVRLFRTPRAIRNQISANPRDLSPLLWAKLVHAALHLTEEDLPRIGGKEAKCPFFVPKDQAQLIADRTTVKRFLEVVELTEEELAAVQEDLDKLEAAVERTQHLRAPALYRRQAKGTKTRGIPLTVLNSPHMLQEGGDYVIGD